MARQSLSDLRSILNEARDTDDAERIHAALVEVVDGLIGKVEAQEKLLAELQSDMTHKQGIVTKIGGGAF